MYGLARRIAVVGIALSLSLSASTARAQAIFGAAELDEDELQLYLLGGSWAPGGLGWKPFVSVVGYHLRFPVGTTTQSRNVVTPTLGLMSAQPDQSLEFGVGYAFADEDSSEPLLIPAPSADGVVASFGWNYWGAGNRMGQVLAAYNFGNEFLWARGRAAVPLSAGSPLWVGGEAAILGGGDESAYIAQFGPMVEWRFSPQFRLGASAGLKVGVSNASGNAAYGRLEFTLLPTAK
jgi:hypothetical protein